MEGAARIEDGYRLDTELGRGGMGVVYRAVHRELGRVVALKVLEPSLGADADSRARFLEEGRLASRIKHPNVVGVLESGVDAQDVLYVVYEFIEGEDLSATLSRRGPLPPAEAIGLVVQVLDGLQAIHDAGIVHRDLKPGNIRVDPGGTPRILDFGIARDAFGERQKTRTGIILGTPGYLAPEVVLGRPASAASDLYSVAAMLFELLVGRQPFTGTRPVDVFESQLREKAPTLKELLPATPQPLSSLLARTLDASPDARPASASAFASSLQAILKGLSSRGTSRREIARAPAVEPAPSGSLPTLASSARNMGLRQATIATSAVPRARLRTRRLVAAVAASLSAALLVALLLVLASPHPRPPSPAPPPPSAASPAGPKLDDVVQRLEAMARSGKILDRGHVTIRRRLADLAECGDTLVTLAARPAAPQDQALVRAGAGAVLGLVLAESRLAAGLGVETRRASERATAGLATLGPAPASTDEPGSSFLARAAELLRQGPPADRRTATLAAGIVDLAHRFIRSAATIDPPDRHRAWQTGFDRRADELANYLKSSADDPTGYFESAGHWTRFATFADVDAGPVPLTCLQTVIVARPHPLVPLVTIALADHGLRAVYFELVPDLDATSGSTARPAGRRSPPPRLPPVKVSGSRLDLDLALFRLAQESLDLRWIFLEGPSTGLHESLANVATSFARTTMTRRQTVAAAVKSLRDSLPETLTSLLRSLHRSSLRMAQRPELMLAAFNLEIELALGRPKVAPRAVASPSR